MVTADALTTLLAYLCSVHVAYISNIQMCFPIFYKCHLSQELTLHFSLSILTAIFQADLGQRFQNVSILDFVGAKDDGSGGDKWICKTSQIVTINKPTSSFYPRDAYHSVILATATWLAGCLSHASIVSIS